MKFYRKDKIVILSIIILSIISIIFTLNNDKFYKKDIMKITNIETIDKEVVTNPKGLHEIYNTKIITGVITNNKNKGTIEKITYVESYSSIITDKYKVGDKVFISNHDIDGLKRDTYIVSIISVFVLLMYLLGRIRGLVTILNIVFSTLLFYFSLELYFKGISLLLLTIIEIIIFTIISLFIASGKNKKTLSAIISTIISIIILLI